MKRFLAGALLALGLVHSGIAPAAEVTVSAAASLRDAFTDIAREFERLNPPHRVLLNFGASGQLLQQITRGAPVDVFAAADQDTMNRAQKQNLIVPESRANFVRNRLVLVVPADGGAPVQSLSDLARLKVERIAIGNPDAVPAGRYAKGALEAAGLWETLKPRLVNTQNVRQALDYVTRGEADAGFVYATDAAILAGRARVVTDVPTSEPILYPIAVVKGGGSQRLGEQFAAFVRSDAARRVLDRYGFLRP